ncbi:hypothetical protein BS47DRAFT_1400421 [Hydnum rufescens UP504]|uniref:Uncharacterized protein n=1 Tax=Hydnum rufescens UP504 TaxID=1448309 RepID=A0A9P6AGE8_9AGAM|nr:hypothetical protein BS47DRAFT_1400421 [Hydnum rufescens UP504]
MDEKNANAFTASEEETLDLLNMVPSQERAPKRKIGFAIIPYCSLLYLLSASALTHPLFAAERWIFPFSDFLGRVNIDQAVLTGLQKDLHLNGNQYDIALTVFFVSLIGGSVLLWYPDDPRRAWRTIPVAPPQHDSCSASPKVSPLPFFNCTTGSPRVSRDYFPLTTWYNRNEQNWAISLFFAGASLGGGYPLSSLLDSEPSVTRFVRKGAFGGTSAFGIRHMAHIGGKDGWSWIFILEALILKGIDSERMLHRLAKNHGVTVVHMVIHDILALKYISVAQPLYSVGLFTPTIINELGYTNADAAPTGHLYHWRDARCHCGIHHPPHECIDWGQVLHVSCPSRSILGFVFIGVSVALFLCVGGCNPGIATSITLLGNIYGPVYTRGAAIGFFISVGNCAAGSYLSSTVPRNFRGSLLRSMSKNLRLHVVD